MFFSKNEMKWNRKLYYRISSCTLSVFVFCVCVRMCESVYSFFWCKIKLLSAWVFCSQHTNMHKYTYFGFCHLFSSARQIKLNSRNISAPSKISTNNIRRHDRVQNKSAHICMLNFEFHFENLFLGLFQALFFFLFSSSSSSSWWNQSLIPI